MVLPCAMTQTKVSRDSESPSAAGLPVAIYARADGPDADRKIDVQLVVCRELAALRQLVVSHELIDRDNASVRGHRRPGYAELLELLTAGTVGGVIAYDADRFSRRPQELLALTEAADASRATVHTVAAGGFDLGTAEGRATLRLVAGVFCVSDDRDRPRKSVARQERAARVALARRGVAR